MKEERLDQILLRLGYVTEAGIEQALLRQKSHGGRLGSHLVFFKFLTEGELVHALSEQFKVPAFQPEKHDVSPEAVRTIPLEVAEDYEVLPIQHDDGTGSVTVVAVDPYDENMITKIKQAFHARDVSVLVASESLLQILISRHYQGEEKATEIPQIDELPELLESDNGDEPTGDGSTAGKKTQKTIAVITKSKTVRTLLAPIFEREGVALQVLSTQKEIREALKTGSISRVLVSESFQEQFQRWIREGRIPTPKGEISTFSSVSEALLDNPAPYGVVIKSLFQSLHFAAAVRAREGDWMPPYTKICGDIETLARTFGFRRLAVDGLQIVAYLLVPSGTATAATDLDLGFVNPSHSLSIAKTLRFPWDVEEAMHTFFDIVFQRDSARKVTKSRDEMSVGAQILAIVWYQHLTNRSNHVRQSHIDALKQTAGRLATNEIIDVYARLLGDDAAARTYKQIFILGPTSEVSSELGTRLSELGFRILEPADMAEAQRLSDRRAPVAVILDHESYPDGIKQVTTMSKKVHLYAFTKENEPAHTLDLLDAGFDDVFAPPYNYDVITARINKALQSPKRQPSGDESNKFSAHFTVFSPIDLIQSLGQGLKTVRVDLENAEGETGTIFIRKGRMVHAVCGRITGEKAIYRIIEWGDDGSFNVTPTDDLPKDNIKQSNEAILMEGCRLLDESTVR